MDGNELRLRAVGAAGAGLLRSLGRTWRYRVEGREHFQALRARGRPVIFAFWHAWILPMAYLHRGEGVVVLVSAHRDGEYIARTIERMGFRTTRGSSTREGVRGLKGMVRALNEGADAAVTPDGPRGPAREFKPGGLLAAQLSGAPIIPIAVDGAPAWRLRSWDRFAVPKPFARIRVRYGPAHFIPRESTAEARAEHAVAVASAMSALGTFG